MRKNSYVRHLLRQPPSECGSTPLEGFLAAAAPICFFFNQTGFRDALNQIKATIYKIGGDYLAKYHVLGMGYDYDYYSLATAKWTIDADSQ